MKKEAMSLGDQIKSFIKWVRENKEDLAGKSTPEAMTMALKAEPLGRAKRYALAKVVMPWIMGHLSDMEMVSKVENVATGKTSKLKKADITDDLLSLLDNKEMMDKLDNELGEDMSQVLEAVIDLYAQVGNGGFEQWFDNGHCARTGKLLLDFYHQHKSQLKSYAPKVEILLKDMELAIQDVSKELMISDPSEIHAIHDGSSDHEESNDQDDIS